MWKPQLFKADFFVDGIIWASLNMWQSGLLFGHLYIALEASILPIKSKQDS